MESILTDRDEERAVNHLILHAFLEKQIGLLNGRMGIAITFYLLGRKLQNDLYIHIGDKLLYTVITGLTTDVSNDFATGFCGIGWGIEFLTQQNFIVCDSDVCDELDRYIMDAGRDAMDCSLEKGVEGVLHYVLAHIQNSYLRKIALPFTPLFLKQLYQRTDEMMVKKRIKSEQISLFKQYKCWYESREIKYQFDLSAHIANVEFSDMIFQQNMLALNNGLAGYLLSRIL